MSFGADFVLTVMTNDPALAAWADAAGVDRIGIDLDRRDKHLRQGPSYRISEHDPQDLTALRAVMRHARLFARTDPLHEESAAQIEQLLDLGAEVLMLPMFTDWEEAATFVELVAGRADVSLLVETAAAAVNIHEIARLQGVSEVFVGLNDLHLSLRLRSRFEILASGLIEMIADAVLAAGVRFGFGGLGRYGDASLPISSELIYPHYPRLGATSALLARSFYAGLTHAGSFAAEVARSRRELDRWDAASRDELMLAREVLRSKLHEDRGSRALAA